MKGISLNITAIVLYVVGGVVISGSNIWIMSFNEDHKHIVTISASNLVSVFSMGVGAILTQVDIYNKNTELRLLKSQHIV
jgi:hypothetical protein